MRPVRVGLLCGIGLAGVVLSACSGPLSTLDPAGPAAEIDRASVVDHARGRESCSSWWWWGLFSLAFVRPAWLSGISARNWIVHGGITMSSVVILMLLVAAFILGERLIARQLADSPLTVQANGRMWVWEFAYPEADGQPVTIGVLHIPAGQPVDVRVTSSDVIHSFWSPRLAGKIDAVPGHENVVRLTADRPGTYRGVCAEFCGAGHTDMRFSVVAHPPGEYEQALAEAVTAEGAR